MVAPVVPTVDLLLRLPFDDAALAPLDPTSTTGPKLTKVWTSLLRNHARRLVQIFRVVTDAERSFVDADLDYLSTAGTDNTPLSVAALLSIETKLRMQRGAILPRFILDLVSTTECLSILRFGDLCPTSRLSSFYLHLGRLCSSRLRSFDHSAPPAVPSTPSFIPFVPTISVTSTPCAKTTSDAPLQVLHEISDAPLQVITAPHPSAYLPDLCLLNMTRRLQTRLCLTHSFLLEYVLLEPGKVIMASRLKTIFSSMMGSLRFQRCVPT
jgi:hypothetical protein